MPADVTLTDDKREEIDPDIAGMELYAPVHGYIFCASGRIMGAFDGILAMQRNCATSIAYRGASRARRDPFRSRYLNALQAQLPLRSAWSRQSNPR